MSDEVIRSTVIVTLRQVAEWVWTDAQKQMLRDAAGEIERLGPKDWTFCPMCSEVTCDEDCALLPIRQRSA